MIGDTTYPAGTDHGAMPAAHVDRIRNPAAWVGSTPPALSSLPYGKSRISPADLSNASRARAALGVNTAERRWQPTAALTASAVNPFCHLS